MQVYKFGGASVKDAKGVRNVAQIILQTQEPLIVVVSAMGKMTNAFEKLIDAYFTGQDFRTELKFIIDYHYEIIEDLKLDPHVIESCLAQLRFELNSPSGTSYNLEYDRFIGFGELLSTKIVHAYLQANTIETEWVDIRNVIKTDSNYRFARIDWSKTELKALHVFNFKNTRRYLTQGFIGSTEQMQTTSLGREGSDYTAAILSYALQADNLTIWKDVPGVLNADPRIFPDATLIENLSYYDAIELAFFGAQIIHPKTMQPLKHKNIPLHVKSFIDPQSRGTVVSQGHIPVNNPIVIIKDRQILFSIKSRDFSFIDESNISLIFEILSKYNAKVNLMQNGAVSFSILIDYIAQTFESLIAELTINFEVRYNLNLKLVTIRHYTNQKINELTKNQVIYLEQKSRNTAQFILDM